MKEVKTTLDTTSCGVKNGIYYLKVYRELKQSPQPVSEFAQNLLREMSFKNYQEFPGCK